MFEVSSTERELSPSGPRRKLLGPLLIAILATTATIATLGPAANGPGVTCDEVYHVIMGKRLVSALRRQGPAFFTAANIRRNFSWPEKGPPVQAPLGHWALGTVHHLFDPVADDPAAVSIAAARFAPAMAFGLLVLLVGIGTMRTEGPLAGTVAAAAVVLVPRVFGHAHFAALDMLTALAFVAALCAVMEAARGSLWWHFALAGVVWGLALLVRLHGLLLLPPVVAWALWRWRLTAWRPLVSWMSAAAVTLLVGWPWLWLSPIGNLWRYVGSGAGRQAVNVFYSGKVWADHDVPWHYPAVMFIVTVPVVLLLLGGVGVWARRRSWKTEPELALMAAVFLFVLLIFSLPGVPVYDGVRLYLMVFPLWSVWVGMGAKFIVESPTTSRFLSRQSRMIIVGLLLLVQGIGLVIYHPCQLSYYNFLVGNLAGAERIGFEVSYWGDAITEDILAEAVERSAGGPILFGPNLAPFQAPAVAMSSAALVAGESRLVGWDAGKPELAAGCRYAVVYHRRADLAAVDRMFADGWVVVEHRKLGVWVTRLIELPGDVAPKEGKVLGVPPRRTTAED